jgi:hypothetical protein
VRVDGYDGLPRRRGEHDRKRGEVPEPSRPAYAVPGEGNPDFDSSDGRVEGGQPEPTHPSPRKQARAHEPEPVEIAGREQPRLEAPRQAGARVAAAVARRVERSSGAAHVLMPVVVPVRDDLVVGDRIGHEPSRPARLVSATLVVTSSPEMPAAKPPTSASAVRR